MYQGWSGYRNTVMGYAFGKVDIAVTLAALTWFGLVDIDYSSLREWLGGLFTGNG
jgi:hypothetical protein